MQHLLQKLAIATLLLSVVGCQNTPDRSYSSIRDAPLEPGQTTFQRQRASSSREFIPLGDAPLEPGETNFQRQRNEDGLPEPGQIMMEGPESSELIPEPGQTEMQ
ncbi:hypothetical protein FHS77_002830 [Paenochrobactrum gallinarii]|uniref:Uncharacterized protein n=1 Tax=Paenochrobactrum gallinarii TaxID=643673 RepID=A0A841M7Y4_9HYPH|nr:hypothetical protein [Paenochrobactrum gallinarii]MBB6262258.1 hypothetical protein [Paenochrobactrum gallinarii]